MNENLDLTEILRDCPAETKLYSPLLGEVKFVGISDGKVVVRTALGEERTFTPEGLYHKKNVYPDAECLLFPSKDNRDWDAFRVPVAHQHFEPFQRVLVDFEVWTAAIYSHWDGHGYHLLSGSDGYYITDAHILPYEGNEDKLGKPIEA